MAKTDRNKERRIHIRVSQTDMDLVEKIKKELLNSHPERRRISNGEIATQAFQNLAKTLGIKIEGEEKKKMVTIF